MWIVPEEVIQNVTGYKKEKANSYQDPTKVDSNQLILKTEDLEYKYNWWLYLQIKDLFHTDKKKYGFRQQNTKLEIILLGDDKK